MGDRQPVAVVVVTGASSDVGAATARALVVANYRVLLLEGADDDLGHVPSRDLGDVVATLDSPDPYQTPATKEHHP